MRKHAKTKKTVAAVGDHPHAVCITPTPLQLCDPQTGLEIAETILLGVHGGTGLVAGFQFASGGYDPARLIYCIKNCLLPKNDLLRLHDLDGTWPVAGSFAVFQVAESVVGDMGPLVSKLCRNLGIHLEICPDDSAMPLVVQATATAVRHRIEEAFCLSAYEIAAYPQHHPDLWRRVALNAFTYRPGRGFVEVICPPPEWENYLANRPLRPLDEYQQQELPVAFEKVAAACLICAHPSLAAINSTPADSAASANNEVVAAQRQQAA
jgi:hypothetical protein